MRKRIVRFFSKPIRLVILNAFLLLTCVALNSLWQVFCIPSAWATVFISICFLNTISYPVTVQFKSMHALIGFIHGLSFCLFIYCIIFLGQMNFFGLIMILMGVGLVTFVPHFLLLQLFWKTVVNPISKTIQYAFIVGVSFCFIGTFVIGYQYKQALTEMQIAQETNFETLEQTFFNEKILGMHFIYHTRFCEFDGWRPPIHEPLLVLGMWMNDGGDPIFTSLEERIELYKKHFPNNKIKFDCSCAVLESSAYHNDLRLQ